MADNEIAGHRIHAGTDVFYSPYHVHRHPPVQVRLAPRTRSTTTV